MTNNNQLTRREFCNTLTTGAMALGVASVLPGSLLQAKENNDKEFKLNYVLASAMYGTTALNEILPEVKKIGASQLDIWPRPHGNQREQVTEMGAEKFATLLEKHDVNLAVMSSYKSGPFGLAKEMELANKIGGKNTVFICGGKGPKNLTGDDLKAAVKKFAELMKPHMAVAAKYGYVIGVENHANNLIYTPDSCKWLAEFTDAKHLGIAVAPHHLETLKIDGKGTAKLIAELGDHVAFFYAQQHGMGSSKKLPKEQEILQMPGRGDFDFGPSLQALKKINYAGLTEIFMHPVPRGVPIRETTKEITAEINLSRIYLEKLLGAL